MPHSDSFGDAPRRLAEAVNLVAAIEDRSPELILAEAQSFGDELHQSYNSINK